jgi:Fic family protein
MAAQRLGLSEVTIGKAARHLMELGIVSEVTGRPRNKLYSYQGYLALLNEGTET